ncbi:CD276 antigen homolog [Chanos chanos]|uniref:CD276 antigen homolog n=1 Tax=Chanos chanos TaxID=29144 RepID=A0A6J2VT35_CHACN|nr:CD276 antigen homolog [Chanos chanos]
MVYHHSKNLSTIAHYHNRTSLILPPNRKNCALLLSSVRVSDDGTYTCYYQNSPLLYSSVSLQVFAKYTVQCIYRNPSSGLFYCEASGGYPEGRIQWKLRGQPLSQPSVTLSNKDHHTGLYYMNSSLIINVTDLDALTCVVENPRDRVIVQKCGGADGKPDMQSAGPEIPQVKALTGVVLALFVLCAVPLIVKYYKEHQTHKPQDDELQQQNDLLENQRNKKSHIQNIHA